MEDGGALHYPYHGKFMEWHMWWMKTGPRIHSWEEKILADKSIGIEERCFRIWEQYEISKHTGLPPGGGI